MQSEVARAVASDFTVGTTVALTTWRKSAQLAHLPYDRAALSSMDIEILCQARQGHIPALPLHVMTKPQRHKWATASVNPSTQRAKRRHTLDTRSKAAQATTGATAQTSTKAPHAKSAKARCASAQTSKFPRGKRTGGSNKTMTPSAPSGLYGTAASSSSQPPQGVKRPSGHMRGADSGQPGRKGKGRGGRQSGSHCTTADSLAAEAQPRKPR